MSSFILVRTSLRALVLEVVATDVFPRTSDVMLIMTAVISQVSLHLVMSSKHCSMGGIIGLFVTLVPKVFIIVFSYSLADKL